MKKKDTGFFAEFKKFISRGNVMDLAVATIIGAAFTAIVTALSNGILKPLINAFLFKVLGGKGLESMYTFLVTNYQVDDLGQYVLVEGKKVIDLAASIYIDWGAFISAIINFILIAFVLFCIIKTFNAAKDASENAKDMEKRIAAKQKSNLPLNKAEKKFVEAKEAEAQAQAEADKEAAEAAAQEAAAQAAADKEKAATKSTNELLVELINELRK